MLHTLMTGVLVALTTMPDLETTCQQLDAASRRLPETTAPERMEELEGLAWWIAQQEEQAPLVFICTHNSRRSHIGQILSQAAAAHYGLDHVRTFSGGTEVTAFNPRAVRALRELGVGIVEQEAGSLANVRYLVSLQPSAPSVVAFSKHYSDPANPQSGFAAVMTCAEADGACPLVFGAAARFSVPYVDPKASDGTDREAEVYRERALQIGTEMFYVMRRAAELRGS
jgi:protein-tyrosine-phosphatase